MIKKIIVIVLWCSANLFGQSNSKAKELKLAIEKVYIARDESQRKDAFKVATYLNSSMMNFNNDVSMEAHLKAAVIGNQTIEKMIEPYIESGLDTIKGLLSILENLNIVVSPDGFGSFIFSVADIGVFDNITILLIDEPFVGGMGQANFHGFSQSILLNVSQINLAYEKSKVILSELRRDIELDFDQFFLAIFEQERFHLENPEKTEWDSELPSIKVAGEYYLCMRMADFIFFRDSTFEYNQEFREEMATNNPEYLEMYQKYFKIYKDCGGVDYKVFHILETYNVLEKILRKDPYILTRMKEKILQTN